MLSKATLKLIRSLELKKYRKESGLFVAEGGKTVNDLLSCGFSAEIIIATKEWRADNVLKWDAEVIEVSDDEMKKASFLRTPQGILAVFRQPHYTIDKEAPSKRLCLALDDVQDPGNLGTIIRIADWFGIEEIFCSGGCADAYGPKTVQATMGAIGRVKVFYTDLPEFLSSIKGKAPIYGTFLDGQDMYSKELCGNGIIVMGNEGNGIGKECSRHVDQRIFIPNYPSDRSTSESLNVSMATAIICSEFRRRIR
jgi:TrmH family RNA methyltransferase